MKKRLILTLIIVLLIIPNIAFALTNSTIYCLDNTTLVENITVYVDDNSSTLSLPVHCDWGCDNITNTCNPPEFQQYLLIFIVIIVSCILGYLFIRWVSK